MSQSQHSRWHIYKTTSSGNLLSPLSPTEMQAAGGLHPDAVAGQIKDPNVGFFPDNFVSNPRFLEILHSVISLGAPKDPDYLAAARAQGNGWLCVIDLRTPDGPQGDVPYDDLIAAFEVRNGCVVAGSYQSNDEYRVVGRNGLARFPGFVEPALCERLLELSSREK